MISILPAAGHATRMFGLTKSLLPVPGGTLLGVMLERMTDVSGRALIGANGNSIGEIARLYGSCAHVYRADTATMSETVIMAHPHIALSDHVLFAMPDSFIEDADCFRKLAWAIQSGADVAVALFRARPNQHREGGMVYTDGDRVTDVIDKPEATAAEWIWGALAWKPVFWMYLKSDDPHVGFALPRAIATGLNVRAVFCDGGYYDCGEPRRYFQLIRHLTDTPEMALAS